MYCLLLLTVAAVLLKSFNAQDILTVEAVLGHSVELPCNVTAEKEDDRLNILAWYRNGSTTAFYSSRDLRGAGSVMSSGERYRLVASESEGLDKLQILKVRAADAGVYRCHADFAKSPTRKTFVHLTVIEPPQKLWVIYENGTRVTTASMGSNASRNVGPFYVGDTIYLFCVAFEGKPKPTLSWWTGQRLLKNATTPLSEQRVRSDLRYGPLLREDHGRVFACFAKNNDNTLPLSIDVTIDMYLPPQLVSVRVSGSRADSVSVGRVRADEPLALQCRVLGARPLPSVVWRLNDAQLVNLEQNTTIESSQRLVVSEIQLSITPEYDESLVTCCAPAYKRDAEEFVCAAALPLTVLYPPVLQIVVEEALDNYTLAVVKGSNVSMNCSYQANPSISQLIWFHEDDVMAENTQHTEAAIQPTLSLTSVSESDAGEYVCAATNDVGSTYSEPIIIDVTYPSFCEDETVVEYGVGDNECLNLTCKVKANPEPTVYQWLLISEVNGSKLRSNHSVTLETKDPVLSYERPNGTTTLIYCWGLNGVINNELQPTRCTFMVTDETAPRTPTNCEAIKNVLKEITVTCEEGHDGGMQQKFKFIVYSLDSDEQLVSIINQEPKFMIQEPKQVNYKFVIIAFNEKGDSESVEIEKDDIIDETAGGAETISAVTNITTLALSLCGGVALLALVACGLVLCAHERGSRTDIPRALQDPPLCAFNTDDTCETFHDSDDGSEFNVRRTESFRRAMTKYPPKNFDVRRTSSFHSARYLHENDAPKCNDLSRHNPNCRVHSLQNISRKREMDMLCDHLVMHLPPETSYNVPKPMNTFYTMPRKMHHKAAKEISDETSEITQNSDGFSLPPPPDEFGTYRAASRIRDMPTKPTPTYTQVVRHNSTNKEPTKYNNVIISPMNTVGLPSVSGTQHSVYTYPDDDHQVNTNPFDDSL
ncbi:neural cell adhesion molecule 1-like [Maniola hyperantus]|uniref:neural cell adhesion molecule 1-like n=1 Tax=Aphantopus hyperantus TaxID=2795564 RepID=UPI001568F5E0|nr:synaptogenesis protein syg-2-like [Maniola hyperantus]